jgi:hypothetical protein
MYAISGQESVATAHERDMDQMRDMLKNNQLNNLTASATDSIAPAEPILPLMQHNTDSSSDRPIVSSLDRTKSSAPAKKVTTAESFFQKKSTTPAEKTNRIATIEKTIKETKPTLPKSSKEKEFSKENEKENNKKVGRVEDLVGDEDDSEEDEEVAPRKKVIRGRKDPKEESVEEKEETPVVEPPVRGAMDDFATEMKRPTAPTTTTTGRRRRKKLIQKTSMDAQGYLHTETQEVWEDIPSDEEDEPVFVPKKPTTQQASNKKVNMKQGSLLGFFTKK